MPQPHTARLPAPTNADEFEEMCVDAMRIRWRAHPQRNGRRGQAQQGVDLFGRAHGTFLGAQCKNTTALSLAVVRQEAALAREFKPTLTTYLLLTSTPRDARLQEEVRVYFHEHPEPFSVDVLFWEDILAHLTSDPSAVRKFWPGAADAMLGAPPDALAPFDDELRYLRAELERVAKWGEQLNVLSYYYRQTGPVPPREYSETVGSAEFEALWARVAPRSMLDEYLRTTINDVRDALRAWDKEATDFARCSRSGALSEHDLREQDRSARAYGIRMQNSASSAIRTLDALLGPRST